MIYSCLLLPVQGLDNFVLYKLPVDFDIPIDMASNYLVRGSLYCSPLNHQQERRTASLKY